MSGGEKEALSVSAAITIAKSLLQQHAFRITGEVSELSDKPGYKAVYFTIKDNDATLSCLMWKNRYAQAGVPLRIGAKVVVTGKFTIFAPKGRMNFEVSSLSLAGDGDLRAQVAALAEKLRQEGLMDTARKRPLVIYPQRIGLVTSPRGAAVHDVLRTLRRRFPAAKILLAGVPVEGKQASLNMIEALHTVVAAGAEEVLVVRGGGSFEDLMPFNDEALARAIAQCPVPVITGIGHEPDTSIADMVADYRASTPTAAAEAVSPHQRDVALLLDEDARRMKSVMRARLNRSDEYLNQIAARPVFRDPLSLFATDFQMLDVLQMSLDRSLGRYLPVQIQNLNQLSHALNQAELALLHRYRDSLVSLQTVLEKVGTKSLEPRVSEVALMAARLHDLSPLKTLARGWSIAHNEDGVVVQSITQVKPGDRLSVRVKDGLIDTNVISTDTADIVDL
ncbi:MAG: exodeoxyribonuclease VII large subunit [Eggerthellaceae bacterium]|nr:exodeoxyribonuclease VII large subunit [Eggerthellaceae bacterium]